MESDSTFSALALGISVLVFAITELGAASIAGRIQALTSNVLNGQAGQSRPLRLVMDLPAGPTAPLRLLNLIALAAAMVSVTAVIWSGWGVRWDLTSAGAVVMLLVLAAVTYVARSLGVRHADRLCKFMPRVAWLLSFPLRPVLLIEAMIIKSPLTEASPPSDPSLDFTLAVDSTEEMLDEHEVRMIRGVFQLDQTVAREIMVPRVDIVAVDSNDSLESLVDKMNSAGHSRIPIYGGDLDHIVGVAHARDVLQELARTEDASNTAVQQVSRKPLFIPESKTLEGLLEVFREERTHLAIVVDEYGGVSGIVTIEDLLEEIVGEIQDEFDAEEPEIQRTGESEFVLDAGMPIDELNEYLGVNVVGNGFDTIGGFVFDRLGKIPVAGDRVDHAGLSIEVIRTMGRRPTTLRITLVPLPNKQASDAE